MLPAQERCQDILGLIGHKQYFVIHAARQSGKTTLLKDLTRELNTCGDYYALYCSLETQEQMAEVEQGIPAIIDLLIYAVEVSNLPEGPEISSRRGVSTQLKAFLSSYCKSLDKPLVVLFDEVDCLVGKTLVSFLRQLRDGYINRGEVPFVHSMGLAGMRDIRDLRVQVRPETETLG